MLTNDLFVKTFQRLYGLNDDGVAGEATFTDLDPRSWPLRNLVDGRNVLVTNGFDADNHKGVDLFWWQLDSDLPARLGYSTPYGKTSDGADGQAFYPFGTRAVAAANGLVTLAEQIGTGLLVLIEHANGDSTGYFHGQQGTQRVLAGDAVARGDALFTCGWDLSNSTSPTKLNPVHLHFSAQRDGAYMDPETWLRYAQYLPMEA